VQTFLSLGPPPYDYSHVSINYQFRDTYGNNTIGYVYPSDQPRLVSGGGPARRGEVSHVGDVAAGHAWEYGL